MKLRTLIIVIALIILIAGVVFYFLIHQNNNGPSVPNKTGSLPSTTAQTFSGGTGTSNASGTSTASSTGTSPIFGIVSNDPTTDYFVDAENNTTLVEPSGVVETIANGSTTVLSSTTFQNVIGASFSYDGKKVLVSSGIASDPRTNIFDVTTKSWLSLPQGMESPVWSPSGYQIASLGAGNNGIETISLETLSATSTRSASLASLAIQDSSLAWPSKNTLVIADRPSAFTVGSALSFNVPTKTVTPLLFERQGMESIWSNATPMTGLFFSGSLTTYQGGELSLLNSAGTETLLSFVTLTTKCVFNEDVTTSTQTIAPSSTKARSSSTTTASTTLITLITSTTTLDLYCAVPRDQNTLQITQLPDEYDQKVLFTADDFYKISVVSGTLSTVFSDPTQTLDATDPKIFNNILFFVNRYDQKLYAIKLQ